jgi:hypothetical protein
MAKKRAFVRYSKQVKIVPGSLILTSGSYPNGPSTWKEVSADLCCDDVVVATRVSNATIGNVSIRLYCDSTLIDDWYSSENSTSISMLVDILNEQFSDVGVFAAAGSNAVTITLSATQVKELGCTNGNLIFQIFAD